MIWLFSHTTMPEPCGSYYYLKVVYILISDITTKQRSPFKTKFHPLALFYSTAIDSAYVTFKQASNGFYEPDQHSRITFINQPENVTVTTGAVSQLTFTVSTCNIAVRYLLRAAVQNNNCSWTCHQKPWLLFRPASCCMHRTNSFICEHTQKTKQLLQVSIVLVKTSWLIFNARTE